MKRVTFLPVAVATVAGMAVFMAPASGNHAPPGGWGSAHSNIGKRTDVAVLKTCFPCHQAIKSHDFISTFCSQNPNLEHQPESVNQDPQKNQ